MIRTNDDERVERIDVEAMMVMLVMRRRGGWIRIVSGFKENCPKWVVASDTKRPPKKSDRTSDRRPLFALALMYPVY